MKILIVCPYFYPSVGGVQNYVLNIAGGLKKDYDYEIIIVTSGEKSGGIKKKKLKGIMVYSLPYQIKVSNSPFSFRWKNQLKEVIKIENPDVINAHSPVPGLADVAFSVRGEKRFIITYHAGTMKKGSPIIDLAIGFYEKTLLKRMLKKSDSIVSVYPEFIKTLVPYKQINFIPPGVDTDIFKPAKSLKKEFDVLFVGRIDKSSSWKGVDVLLKAIAGIFKIDPKIKLRLVGDGDATDGFKEMSKDLGIGNNVTFSGFLKNKELVKAYNSSKMLALPSKTDAESFGMVLIEAMSCGLPVIASKVGGVPNVISNKKYGLLIPPSDPEALAAAITKVLTNKMLRERLAANSLETVKRRFNWRDNYEATYSVFEKVSNG